MSDFDTDLTANYQALAASRDWSLDEMADNVADRDPALAGYLRSLAAPAVDAAPKARRSNAKTETAEG